MTNLADLQIQQGLPERFRLAAAKLYYDVFGQKMKPIIGPEATGVAILERVIDPAYSIMASSGDQLFGVAGYTHQHRQFVYIKLAVLREHFGIMSSAWRYVLFLVANRWPRQGELLMDGLVVHPTMRGKGLGTRLLDAMYQFARERDYHSIRLDVVDTNPNARRLYERVGFVPVATHHYPFLRSLGFSATTTMIRPVG